MTDPTHPTSTAARGRSAAADRAARVVTRASRRVGRPGAVVGGRVLLAVEPGALTRLAEGRRCALVTGSNGKTTTTRLLRDALTSQGPVASNLTGANLPSGVAAALLGDASPTAVLEVDEAYLPSVVEAVRPQLVVLTNLSRDQLDRVGEVSALARRWRVALAALPDGSTVVANVDDPYLVWAAGSAPDVVWVAAGQWWTADATVCPACGAVLLRGRGGYRCGCGFARPRPHWEVADGRLTGPAGEDLPVALSLPGRANRANAALAAAAASRLGVAPATALAAASAVRSVADRYAWFDLDGLRVRVLLAKNPAGWLEVFDVLGAGDDPVVVALNSRAADGRDVSWLWDVAFERLAGRRVVATGERRLDLAVRLEVAGVAAELTDTAAEALRGLAADTRQVQVVASYSAMGELVGWLRGHGTVGDGGPS